MAYSTGTQIRGIHEMFASSTDFPDGTLTGWASTYGDPIIDDYLRAAGFSVPFETAPDSVAIASAHFAAAFGMRKYAKQLFGGDAGIAATIEQHAWSILKRIVSGELDTGTTRDDDGYAISYERTPEDMIEESIYPSPDEEMWERPNYTRTA